MFVGDAETEMIVAHITFYNLRLLQSKFGCTFPSAGIQHDLIHMTPLRLGAGTRCEKIDIRRCTNGCIAVQNRQKWDLTLCLIGLNRGHESFDNPCNVFLLPEFTRVTPTEIYLVPDISINEPKDLRKETVSREQPELRIAVWVWCGWLSPTSLWTIRCAIPNLMAWRCVVWYILRGLVVPPRLDLMRKACRFHSRQRV